jgi:1-acyl-sn-glycerol-3-phosphate acyltransferase
MRFVRGCAAILVALFYNGLVVFPHLFLVRIWALFITDTPTETRELVARWMTWHGDRLFRILAQVLRLRLSIKLPAEDVSRVDGPLIVVSNHQSTMDIPLVYAMMEMLGRPSLRWIIKRSLIWTPFGLFGWMTGCAFVRRNKADPDGDLAAIAQCGVGAALDEAAVVIYPEGTRCTSPAPGYLCLLAPKTKGFALLRQAMPNAGVVSITLRWDREGGRGRTWLDAADFVGRRLSVWVAAS